MLKIEGLKVVRGDFTVSLPEITIADGECVALCGVSGSGKSTLIDRKSTRLNSSHNLRSRMPSSA